MVTHVIINLLDLPNAGRDWEFNCRWAVFLNTKKLLFEVKYVGKTKWFQKTPCNLWIHEDRIELVYINTPGEE